MPFTFSHPAAVIPLFYRARHPLIVLALIVGSISPDVGYYLQAFALATYAHSFTGTMLLCVPVGLVLLGGLLLFRNPILYLIPSSPRQLLAKFLVSQIPLTFSFLASICLWLWVGALTHVMWDSFTHRTGWVVQNIPVLQREVFFPGNLSVPLYVIVQQASTVLGALVIVFFYLRAHRRNRSRLDDRFPDRRRYVFWIGLGVGSLLFALPMSLAFSAQYSGFFAVRVLVFRTAVYAGAIFFALICASLFSVRFLSGYKEFLLHGLEKESADS